MKADIGSTGRRGRAAPAGDGEEEPRPTYRVSAYTVYPSGYDRVAVTERESWRVTVIDTGEGWSIRWRSRCLNIRNTWQLEPPRRGHHSLLVDGMNHDEFVEQVQKESAAKAAAELRKERRSPLSLFQRTGQHREPPRSSAATSPIEPESIATARSVYLSYRRSGESAPEGGSENR